MPPEDETGAGGRNGRAGCGGDDRRRDLAAAFGGLCNLLYRDRDGHVAGQTAELVPTAAEVGELGVNSGRLAVQFVAVRGAEPELGSAVGGQVEQVPVGAEHGAAVTGPQRDPVIGTGGSGSFSETIT